MPADSHSPNFLDDAVVERLGEDIRPVPSFSVEAAEFIRTPSDRLEYL